MKKYLSLILILLVVISCKEKLTEQVVEKFPDGGKRRVQYFKEGVEPKVMVKEVFYYQNGQKRVEGYYNAEGNKDGKWIYWYEDGTKWSEGYFSNGENDKKRTTWHENGELHYSGTYDKGKRIGVWKFFDETGKLAKEIDYDKNPEGE